LGGDHRFGFREKRGAAGELELAALGQARAGALHRTLRELVVDLAYALGDFRFGRRAHGGGSKAQVAALRKGW
jgi:hypothetical protein